MFWLATFACASIAVEVCCSIWFLICCGAEAVIVTVSLNLLSRGWLLATDTHNELIFILFRSHKTEYDTNNSIH